ncbi:MAG: alanine--glyoxylate aminotransferase family protein [Clostridiaceae bacterium]|nr:alanine--glyoxylate aminotransferase family protein [Clostridiaceae bacterium]
MTKLMIPGPTEVSPAVLEQLAKPIRHHYGPDFVALYFEVVEKLKTVFQTRADLFILAATSSAAMEIALSHAAQPGEKVLICRNGFFGERFTEMANYHELSVITVDSPYGQPVDPAAVKALLDKHPDIKAVALVHNESSTAVETGLKPILDLTRARGILSVVDAVSSLGGADVPTDGLGIDFCVSGSQKCLAAPAGLSFVSVSESAWQAIARRAKPVRSWYLNLENLRAYREKWQNWHPQGPNTAPVSLYLALNQALDELLAEGLPARFARQIRVRDAFRASMRAMGLGLFTDDSCASKTLTAVRMPAGIDGSVLLDRVLRRHDILLAGGIGPLASQLIRVGHMAWTASEDYLLPTIQALETELLAMGAAIQPGGADIFRAAFHI